MHVAVLFVHLFRALAALKVPATVIHALGIALTPLFKKAPEVFRRHDVLPLNAPRPLFVRQRNVFARVKDRTAVESHTVIHVDLSLQRFLGFVKGVNRGVAGSVSRTDRKKGRCGSRCKS